MVKNSFFIDVLKEIKVNAEYMKCFFMIFCNLLMKELGGQSARRLFNRLSCQMSVLSCEFLHIILRHRLCFPALRQMVLFSEHHQ